jgi:hypothetical protein
VKREWVLGGIMIGGKRNGIGRDHDWWKERGIGRDHDWWKKELYWEGS